MGTQSSCTPAQHSTAQHSTAQHSTAQHSTAQHSTAQHSTAQHSMHSSSCHTLLAQAFDVLSSLGGALFCCCLLTQIVQNLGFYSLCTHAYVQTMPAQVIQTMTSFVWWADRFTFASSRSFKESNIALPWLSRLKAMLVWRTSCA